MGRLDKIKNDLKSYGATFSSTGAMFGCPKPKSPYKKAKALKNFKKKIKDFKYDVIKLSYPDPTDSKYYRIDLDKFDDKVEDVYDDLWDTADDLVDDIDDDFDNIEESYDDLLELLIDVFDNENIDIMKYIKLPKEVKDRMKRDNNLNDILD